MQWPKKDPNQHVHQIYCRPAGPQLAWTSIQDSGRAHLAGPHRVWTSIQTLHDHLRSTATYQQHPDKGTQPLAKGTQQRQSNKKHADIATHCEHMHEDHVVPDAKTLRRQCDAEGRAVWQHAASQHDLCHGTSDFPECQNLQSCQHRSTPCKNKQRKATKIKTKWPSREGRDVSIEIKSLNTARCIKSCMEYT